MLLMDLLLLQRLSTYNTKFYYYFLLFQSDCVFMLTFKSRKSKKKIAERLGVLTFWMERIDVDFL